MSKSHLLGEEHSLQLPAHTQGSICGCAEPDLPWAVGREPWLHFPPLGADVIYEVQVTLGSSEHLFCRGLGGVLLTWEEFILTARNRGRLAQHIPSLGAVNCWNSLLAFGMLQGREEGSLQGQEEGLYG